MLKAPHCCENYVRWCMGKREEETVSYPQGSFSWSNNEIYMRDEQEKVTKFNYVCTYGKPAHLKVRDRVLKCGICELRMR